MSTLVHFTNEDAFEKIRIEELLAFPKYLHSAVTIQGNELDYSFVWFTAIARHEGAEIVRESIWNRSNEIGSLLHQHDHQLDFLLDDSDYATTTPFTMRNYPCAEVGFGFDVKDLIAAYSKNLGIPSYRCMGTFIYKKEVMYAVVVHPSLNNLNWKERNFFQQFPEVKTGDNLDEVVYKHDNCFYWKPFSTSSSCPGIHSQRYCRWDHLAFAFYFPKNTTHRINMATRISMI